MKSKPSSLTREYLRSRNTAVVYRYKRQLETFPVSAEGAILIIAAYITLLDPYLFAFCLSRAACEVLIRCRLSALQRRESDVPIDKKAISRR